MRCKRCLGSVYVDRVFSQKLHMELFCIRCGKRWMLDKERNALGRWLDAKERRYLKKSGISS
jgi:hypothetical protein